MEVFTYSFFYKNLLRFGNIPVTIFLCLYLIPIVSYIDLNLIFIIPLVLTLFIIYFLNKQFINLYKILPYRITAYADKIVCDEFLLSKKIITIYFEDIESLTGGIFDGKMRGVLKIFDSRNKVCIGYFNKIKNSKRLGTILLSKVNKDVYDEVIKKVSALQIKRKK